MSQQTPMDSDLSESTDQQQLDLIYVRSRKASQDFTDLENISYSWGVLLDTREENVFLLQKAGPQGLCERDITTISTAELNALGHELRYQAEELVPRPIVNAPQVRNSLVAHKSDVQVLIKDMKLLELKIPDDRDLKAQRCGHENQIRSVNSHLEMMLY